MGRLSRINPVGPKCNQKCPHKRDAMGDLTQKAGGDIVMGGEGV